MSDINLNQIIDDSISVKKYRCSSWANEHELKKVLFNLLASRSWKSPTETFYAASLILSAAGNTFAYTESPLLYDIWKKEIELHFKRLPKVLTIPTNAKFVLLTEPIYEYISISKQLAYLTIFYIDAKKTNRAGVDKVKHTLETYYSTLFNTNIVEIVENDKYNNKDKLIKVLNNEWLECVLDYFYLITDGATAMSTRTYKHFNSSKPIRINTRLRNNTDIIKFMKKLNQFAKSMRNAKKKKDMVTYNKYKIAVEQLIDAFESQKDELLNHKLSNIMAMESYVECNKVINEIRKIMDS